MTFIEELQRRNVFRVAVAYLIGAWLALQVADFVLDAIAAPNWIVQVFILVALLGLPVVLILSWVYELTPEGLKRESEIDRTQPATTQSGKKLDRVIMAFLVIAVGILAGERMLGPSGTPVAGQKASRAESTAGDNTIAVLPFVNMSSDPEQEYFSDGVTEEILNRLAGIEGLRVVARTSVFSFKGENQDIREIARKLGVSTVLEGSVRRAGNDIRVTAQLIRASDGFHLWSETYDRQLQNVFAIQDDIASRIARALQVSMGVSGQSPAATRTVNPQVYDLYLRARALHRQRTSLLQAVELFEQALAIDPDFAPAWAGLSHTLIVIPNYIGDAEQKRLGNVMDRSLAAAERARELDPDLPSAIHAMANNRLFRFEWAKAEQLYQQALELDPDSADIMEDYVSLLTFSGQLMASRQVADRMIELDPYVPVFHNAMIALLWAGGEEEQLDERIGIALEIAPDLPNIQGSRLIHLLRNGRYDEARSFADSMSTIRHQQGELQALIDWLEAGAQAAPSEPVTRTLSENPSYAYLAGRYDLWLDAVRVAGEEWPEWSISPLLDLLSPLGEAEKRSRFLSDPRTKAYIKHLRLPEYWRQVGWPDICRPVGAEDFTCS